MSDPPIDPIEQRLQRAARSFAYPPTPDLTRRTPLPARAGMRLPRPRRALTLVVALVIALSLLAVPQVRAAIGAWLRIGVIEIVPSTPVPAASTAESLAPPQVPTALPTITPIASSQATVLRDLAGATTLEDARRRVGFAIRLPSYPADLGSPDRVYVQNLDGTSAILVWLDPADPERVMLSLHLLSSDAFARKTNVEPSSIEETRVGDQPAVWIDAPHLLEIYDSSRQRTLALRRLVAGHVLIWTDGDLTYRLETDRSLVEAVRIAESLR